MTARQADQRKLERMTTGELLTEARNREEQRSVAEMAATEAAQLRNAAIRVLHLRGVRNSEIAETLGVTPARVGQILDRISPETRQRQEPAKGVRGHTRTLADGRQIQVRAHPRGAARQEVA